jgi:lipopolysaccharide heptosyltransferase II
MPETPAAPPPPPTIAAPWSDVSYDRRPPFRQRLALRAKGHAKSTTKNLLRRLVAAAGRLTIDPAGRPQPHGSGPSIRRILIIRLDLIGDVVLTLPAVRALHRAYPEAEIDFLALETSAGILANEPEIARVLTFDPYLWRRRFSALNPATWRAVRAFVRTMRARHYDLAVSVAGDIASILARLSGAPRRVGFAGEAYANLLTVPVPGGRYRRRQHEVQYVLTLAEAAGARVAASDAGLALHVPREARESAVRTLAALRERCGREGPVVALHPGARNGQAKRWPTTSIATLASRLALECDALVLLTGAAGEAPLAAAVERGCHGAAINLCGTTSLPELTALLAVSDVVVSGDSGPMHIACAVGTRVVALHGPTDPAISGPTAPDALVLRLPLWCSPCYDASATAECRFGNPVCMKGLSADLVFAAVLRQLRGVAPQAGRRVGQPTVRTVGLHPQR